MRAEGGKGAFHDSMCVGIECSGAIVALMTTELLICMAASRVFSIELLLSIFLANPQGTEKDMLQIGNAGKVGSTVETGYNVAFCSSGKWKLTLYAP